MLYSPADLIQALENEFFKHIESKTNWGKEQIKQEFLRSSLIVIAKQAEATQRAMSDAASRFDASRKMDDGPDYEKDNKPAA